MSTTPNMTLVLPDPQTTVGPTYATLEVTAFGLIDLHDHTTGRGVLVPTAGLNINADLAINSHNLNTVRGVRLDSQSSTPAGSSDIRMLYSKAGELAYRDASGNEVVITASGSVAGATGSITGLTSPASAAFASVSGVFTVQKDSSKPAKTATADLLLYEYNNASAAAVTIKSPASLAGAYTLTLPSVLATATSSLVSISSTGVLSAGAADGTTTYPGMGFANETGLGFARVTTQSIDFVSVGATAMRFTASQVLAPDGGQSLPSLSFINDPDTGFYKSASNTIGVGVGASTIAKFSSDGLAVGPAFSGIKWKVATGTITASSTAVITISDATMIYGCVGQASTSTGAITQINGTVSSTLTITVQAIGSTSLTLSNGWSGGSNTYKCVVFYT